MNTYKPSLLDIIENQGLDLGLAILVVILGAIGTSLLMPHRLGFAKPRVAHAIGGVLVVISAGLLALFWRAPGPWLSDIFFYLFGLMAVLGAVLTITSRDPIYSALWFASVVLSTAGLFLLAGAQFLAAGTVIVYAGAIIVTFLFVIMLAQSGGQAVYDRMARSPARATASCYLMLWALLYALIVVQSGPKGASGIDHRLLRQTDYLSVYRIADGSAFGEVLSRTLKPSQRLPEMTPTPNGVRPSHMASLGGTLYTDHVIAAELVSVLLFVSLVGAVAIVAPKFPRRPTPALGPVARGAGPPNP